MQLQLPEPTADALAASQTLQQLIAEQIVTAGGWISFARYMELALYAPALGYYSGGAAKLGSAGDFTTAPEMSSLFGAALAQVVAPLLAQCQPQLLEFGAGSGKLARDVLTELAHLNALPEHYYILDISGELQARQQDMLRDFPQVTWLQTLPDAFSGVVLANEVLDAMPVQLLENEVDGWRERGVALGANRFEFANRPLAAGATAQIPDSESLPIGYVTETHSAALGFIRSLSAMLKAGKGGVALLLDYGFPAHEYYLAQRDRGTLMCHYRHHAHDQPFYLPGLQDITAHLDFTALALTAQESGLEVLHYSNQAAFLLDAGIGELLLRTPADDALRYLPQANAVQRLLSPAEMGELFKVLVLGTGVELPAAFARSDRSFRL
ncbi:MAG: SAM-dependent methyltransferase [Herbaspirillum sp.]